MITTGSGNDTLDGGSGYDVLYAGAGNDVLFSYGPSNSDPSDALYGGSGNDYFDVNALDLVGGAFVFGGAGIDTLAFFGVLIDPVFKGFTLTAANSIERIVGNYFIQNDANNLSFDFDTARFDGTFSFMGRNQYFRALNGDYSVSVGSGSTVIGGSGNSTVTGGTNVWAGDGDDLVQTGLDGQVFGGAGNDTFKLQGIMSKDGLAVHYANENLTTDFEVFLIREAILTDFDDVVDATVVATDLAGIHGLAGNDRILTGVGRQYLDGGAGRDTMSGGLGDDTYYVDMTSDLVIEAADGGFDTVMVTGDYAIRAGSNIEKFYLSDGVRLRGSSDNDSVNGSLGTGQVVVAGAGDDIVVQFSNSTLFGNDGNDTLQGNSVVLYGGDGNDGLWGGDGSDTLFGGAGQDALFGEGGRDTYYIDEGDEVFDVGFGRSVAFLIGTVFDMATSARDLNDLATISDAAVVITGNLLRNRITGTNQNDTLDGGGGVDTLTGGSGDDHYVVNTVGDQTVELAGGGFDSVLVNVRVYQLGEFVEAGVSYLLNSTLFGNDGSNHLTALRSGSLWGQAGDDTLIGSDGRDVLEGGEGADLMQGGAGNDIYTVDSLADVVTEGALGTDGIDRVVTGLAAYTLPVNVEEAVSVNDGGVVLTGNAGNNYLGGGKGADLLVGGAGFDVLFGWLGQDTLTGGTGSDGFVFSPDGVTASIDVITDFSTVEDLIELDGRAEVFGDLGFRRLEPEQFNYVGSTLDRSDRILYNKATGALFYDVDGSGSIAAVQFATLANHAVLTAADFFVL